MFVFFLSTARPVADRDKGRLLTDERALMRVDEVKYMCQYRSKWKAVDSNRRRA